MKPILSLALVAALFVASVHADPAPPRSFLRARSRLFRDFPKPYPPGIFISAPSQPFPLVVGLRANARFHDWQRSAWHPPLRFGFHRPAPHMVNMTVYDNLPATWARRLWGNGSVDGGGGE